MAAAEVLMRFTGDPSQLKGVMAQVRSELSQTAQATKATNQGELTMRQQLSAVASLQRQRSAALIAQWRQQEREASNLARGVQPVATNLQRITDVMQTLARSTATIQGPLGGVAGRLSSLGSIATEASGGLGLIGVAAGAALVAVSALAVGIFNLTKQAAEFQGRMFDLSQQTGLTVETLSTLEFGARQTGGNIDNVAQSMFLFQRQLEEAQDPTSKQAKLFRELGVETKNTEQALRQTLAALARMPEGFQQTDAAATLFGSRGGKQVLAIMKEFNGDLDGATERIRKLNILVTTEAAKAADTFLDKLDTLNLQLRGLVGLIGNELMPEVQAAVRLASDLLVENQGVIRSWVNDIGDAIRGALILADAIRQIGGAVTGLGRIPIPQILLLLGNVSGITGIARGLASLGKQGPFAGVIAGGGPVIPEGTGIRRPSGGGRGGGGRAAKDTFLSDAFKAAELTEREALQAIQADIEENKRALDQQIRDIEEFTTRATQLANQRLQVEIRSLNAQEAALIEALNKRKIKAEEFDTKLRELEIDRAKVRQANSQETFKLEADRDRQISQAQIAAKRRQLEIAEEADKRTIDRIDDRIRQELILESDGERQIAAIVDEGFQRRREALEAEQSHFATSKERREEITDELIKLDGQRAGSAEEAGRRISAAIDSETRSHQEALRESRERTVQLERETAEAALALLGLTGARRVEIFRAELRLRIQDEARRHQLANDSLANQRVENEQSARTQQQKLERTIEINKEEEAEEQRHQLEMQRIRTEGEQGEVKFGVFGGFLSGLETGQLAELEGGVQSFADVATVAFSAVGAAVNGLAQGVGALVQQWVLMGNQADLNLKKVTASVLSSVAAQAATQAVMFLAYGIASLTPWGAAIFGPAGPWFKAAALMASIAVVAGGIGRAVAGNSFAGGGEQPGGPTTQQPQTERDRTIRERRTGGGQEFARRDEGKVEVTLKLDSEVLERVIVKRFQRNGQLRSTLRGDLLNEAGT